MHVRVDMLYGMALRGLVFEIERFAIHDGPGIRTTLFLKGCPLACQWCHNPESISPRRERVFFADSCTSCGKCFDVCPTGAHERLADGTRVYHDKTCSLCGKCVQACVAEALVMEGTEISVEEAVTELARDAPFYASSAGGITLSGGEPMWQAEFCAAVLRGCRERGFHTALETSGFAPWRDFERVLPFTDLVLYDLKLADPEAHRAATGVSNETILDNLVRIDRTGTRIEIRIPVIPGINDDRPNIAALAAIARNLKNLTRVNLLPYHRLGEAKYPRLGRTYKLLRLESPDGERMAQIASWTGAFGLEVHVG